MPQILAAAWFVPLMTAITAGTTVAYTGYELAQGQPGSGTSATTGKSTLAQQQAQQTAAQKQAFLASQGNTQEKTGGSLTPTGFNTETATAAGIPSDLNSLLKYLGTGGGAANTSSAPVSGGITPANGQVTTPGANNQDLEGLSKLLAA